MSYLMGIDLGASSVKTMIIRTDGAVVSKSAEKYPIMTPNIKYAEQDPNNMRDAIVNNIRKFIIEAGNSNYDELLITQPRAGKSIEIKNTGSVDLK